MQEVLLQKKKKKCCQYLYFQKHVYPLLASGVQRGHDIRLQPEGQKKRSRKV